MPIAALYFDVHLFVCMFVCLVVGRFIHTYHNGAHRILLFDSKNIVEISIFLSVAERLSERERTSERVKDCDENKPQNAAIKAW